MVGHQTEGDWASSLLKADFWGRDGNTFLFVIPPEGESTEIQSQLHWNGIAGHVVPDTSFVLCERKGKIKHRGERCVLLCIRI